LAAPPKRRQRQANSTWRPTASRPTRSALQVAIDYAFGQGLLPKRLEVDGLFDDVTRAL